MDVNPKFTTGMPPTRDPKCYTYLDKPIDPAKAHCIAIQLVKRGEWGAREPMEPPKPIPGGYPRVVLWYHDIGVNPCHNAEECEGRVREIQRHHMEDLGLPDIAYNFLIGGDGRVYEGRGYVNNPYKIGDKWAKYKDKSFDVAYIGRFSEDKPAYPDMQHAGNNLLQQATLRQYVDYFFAFVEDVAPSHLCLGLDECRPCPEPEREPGDPEVDFNDFWWLEGIQGKYCQIKFPGELMVGDRLPVGEEL